MKIVASHRPPGRPAPRPAPPVQFPYEPPVNLFASVTVQSGGEAGLRAKALSNLTGKPLAIHEIRVGLQAPVWGLPINNGAFTEISLDLDGKPITNGFVPVWLLGRVDNVANERSDGTTVGASAGVVNSVAVWRLAQPFGMKPGAVVNVTVRHRGMITQPVTADVSLVGKQVASISGLNRIPYVTAFLGKQTEYNEPLVEESPEQTLINLTKVPLNVQRITGRCLLTGVQYAPSNLTYCNDKNVGEYLASLMRVRLAISRGLPLVQDLTPFGALFSPASGNTWEAPFVLRSGEYLIATCDKLATATVPDAADWGGTFAIQAQIAISGWREE